MNYSISGESLPVLRVELGQGERIECEAGIAGGNVPAELQQTIPGSVSGCL